MALREVPPAIPDRRSRRPGDTLVVQEGRSLRKAVTAERALRARSASLASVLRRRTGSWDAACDAGVTQGGFGLPVLDGVLICCVGVNARLGAELLSKGDLLWPWEHDGHAGVLPFELAWRIVVPVRCARPRAGPRGWCRSWRSRGDLTSRLPDRSRRLAMPMAIARFPLPDALPPFSEASGVFAIYAARSLLMPFSRRPSYCLSSFTLEPWSFAIAAPFDWVTLI